MYDHGENPKAPAPKEMVDLEVRSESIFVVLLLS